MEMYRQGDVLLKRIDALPAGLEEKDAILAHGETTGHSHRMVGALVFADAKGDQFVHAGQEAKLVHEEHAEIAIPAGEYAVLRQHEFDLVEGVRQVMD